MSVPQSRSYTGLTRHCVTRLAQTPTRPGVCPGPDLWTWPSRTWPAPGTADGESQLGFAARRTLLTYLIRRLLLGVLTLVGVSFLAFTVFGSKLDPLWSIRLGAGTTEGHAQIAALTRLNHLDAPILERYWLWLRGLFDGHGFGRTVLQQHQQRLGQKPTLLGDPVGPQLWPALEHTAELVGGALVVVVLLSLAIGTIGARRPRSPLDVGLRASSYVAWSIPAFLLALALQQIVGRISVSYHVSPFSFSGLPGPEAGTGFHYALDWLRHFTLPILTVAVGFVGAYSRYVRSSMLVSLRAPYAVVARGKGVSEARVTIRHALRNSLIPFTTVLALDFGAIVGATLAADYVFKLDGFAVYLFHALGDSDPNEIEAGLVVLAAVVVAFSLLADLAYGWLDPRVRLA